MAMVGMGMEGWGGAALEQVVGLGAGCINVALASFLVVRDSAKLQNRDNKPSENRKQRTQLNSPRCHLCN